MIWDSQLTFRYPSKRRARFWTGWLSLRRILKLFTLTISLKSEIGTLLKRKNSRIRIKKTSLYQLRQHPQVLKILWIRRKNPRKTLIRTHNHKKSHKILHQVKKRTPLSLILAQKKMKKSLKMMKRNHKNK